MDTLPLSVWQKHFKDKDHYTDLRRRWSWLCSNSPDRPSLGPEHYLVYLALRGRDWRRAFTPITNQTKLNNGGLWDWGLWRAAVAVHSKYSQEVLLSVFDGLVTVEMLDQIRSMLPVPYAGVVKTDDAYINVPEEPAVTT